MEAGMANVAKNEQAENRGRNIPDLGQFKGREKTEAKGKDQY